MTLYQAYVVGSKHTYEVRMTQEAAIKDLAQTYEVCGLREERGILYDPNRHIGVAIIKV